MNIKSNKLKAAVVASVLALSINNSVFAYDYGDYTQTNHDMSSNFEVHIGGEGSANNEGSRTDY